MLIFCEPDEDIDDIVKFVMDVIITTSKEIIDMKPLMILYLDVMKILDFDEILHIHAELISEDKEKFIFENVEYEKRLLKLKDLKGAIKDLLSCDRSKI